MDGDTIDWLRRVGMVANALTGDVDAQEVAEIVLHQGLAGMGASGAAVVFRYGDQLVPVAAVGTTVETLNRHSPLTIDRQLPMCHALVHGEPVWVTSREEGLARFANLRNALPSSQGWAAAPLLSDGRPFGAVSFVFDTPPTFSAVERQFVTTLTGLAALALSRLIPGHGPARGGVMVRTSSQLCTMFGHAAAAGSPA
ncbi:MAG: GAF domain-containing protein [Acidimicrobiales bacterium]